ncbi:neprilysin-4 [Uranotaenia lowii]|uniref:neprilysin-4 n=1 Tax=Uranotaenia lowii TaxID=190385 RepID=UPI0024794BDF|nr:neprilysin-4 [Uranotaenia lowii]
MQKSEEMDVNNEKVSSKKSRGHGCELGINEQTGRLQWCPGYRFAKVLFVIPAAMLPLALLFLLLTRLHVVGSVEYSAHQYNDVQQYYTDQSNKVDELQARCKPVRRTISEVTDIEDRDLLKDMRTSFVPTRLLSANCPQPDSDGDFLSMARDIALSDIANFFRTKRHTTSSKARPARKSAPAINNWTVDGSPQSIRATQVEMMKKYMDPSMDPCTDFYQYACGNFDHVNPIPKDKASLDTFEILRESLDIVLKNLLIENSEAESITDIENTLVTSPPNPPSNEHIRRVRKRIIGKRAVFNKLVIKTQIKKVRKRELSVHSALANEGDNAETKAKNLFLSCMNYSLIEKRGLQPLFDLLASLGGWPVLDPTWKAENFDWLNLTAQIRKFNNDIMITQWVGADIKNSDENAIQLDQTVLGLPTRDYFLQASNQKYLDGYKQFIVDVIVLLGAKQEKAEQTAEELLDFEIQLANITNSMEERNNISLLYKKMILENLHEEVPEINWTRYLSIVMERPVNSSEFVVMYALNYMKDLVVLIDQTEPRTVANYILWRFVRHRINNLDDRFLQAKQKFSNVLFGREKSPPRWKNCVNQVNANMGMAVGAMFVRKYFDENSKRDTLAMTHELQQAFRDILNETDWLDVQTRRLAEMKVNSMSLRIGYPDFILSRKELNDKYSDLEIDESKYFENTLNVLSHIRRTDQNKYGQVVNKTAWNTAPAVVNAYYSRNKNQIMFPAGILQPPFYHRYFPKSLNYGGIGVVIGHELTHGFDDKGRLFDRDGNLYRWWTDQAIDAFHERATCLIQQYGKYTVDEVGVQIDGENTQGENIADNGGIKQAYRAYTKWISQQTDPQVLELETFPALNVTNEQLFFLNFAQVWCGAMRPEATRNKLKTAVHSPGKFRVIGTLSNSEDFARVYGCEVGTPMNPEDKCSVW